MGNLTLCQLSFRPIASRVLIREVEVLTLLEANNRCFSVYYIYTV